MSSSIYRCVKCGTELQGHSEYCVLCYSKVWRPCPNCMKLGMDSRWRIKADYTKKGGLRCTVCKGDRWVQYDDRGEML